MKFTQLCRIVLFTLILVASGLTANIFGQAQDPEHTEPLPVNSLIIPMDNVNQGNAGGTTFNLRAYGLANALLQNNIPIKWAIKFNKGKDDVDFGATVTKIAGNAGAASGTINFSGGPFVIAPEYLTQAQAQITAFNNQIGGSSDNVTVYRVTAQPAANIDIRYTLTHKPLLAIGPDGGNFGTGVYQTLLDAAGIPNYTSVTDQSMQPTSCYTEAMQAHSVSTQWVSSYRGFVENGGNLLLECASINTFENDAVSGHFQASNGYTVFGTNDGNDISGTPIYPNGFMPFNQFRGNLNGNQDGAITDYILANASIFVNGTLIAARHNNGGTTGNALIATVSKVQNVGRDGGYVFELGGHDYSRGDAADITNINGRRMILNSIFVPVTRPCSQLQQPQVEGYKSVRIFTDQGPTGLSQNDTVEWTVTYINRSAATALDFQINDPIASGMNYVAGSIAVSVSGGATATANAAFNGTSNTQMLAASATLPQNGKITVTFRTVVTPPSAFLQNQATASGINVSAAGIKTDNIDSNDAAISYPGGNVVAPANSLPQEPLQSAASIDPTWISYLAPTAAPATVAGRVVTANGVGIRNISVVLTDATSGQVRYATTNAFGYYIFDSMPTEDFYILSISSKKYTFPVEVRTFTLQDNMMDLDFVAAP